MINSLDNYDDNEITIYDANIIRNSISEDIILDKLYDDIENIFNIKINENKIDYLNEIINKYNTIKSMYSENIEVLSSTKEEFFNILNNVKELIENDYDFNLEFNILLNEETKIDYIYNLYLFFIINIKDTIYNFLINYINFNIDGLIKICKVNKNKNDIIIKNLKNTIKPEYIGIIYNLDLILNTIECNNYDVIVRSIESDPALMENYFINKMFIDEENAYINFEENIINKFKSIINNNLIEFETLIEKYLIDNYKL